MAIAVGQRVANYQILDVLGSVGIGRVYRVSNVVSGRTEAMKVLPAGLNKGPGDEAERFGREVRTLTSLSHPNIAQLHNVIQHGDEQLIIMEFVEGSTLQQIAQRAPLSPQTAASYMQQVLTALSYAHKRGVVHRNIRPSNIMIGPQGVVKLTDFGISRPEPVSEKAGHHTKVDSLNYMSPEQALGRDTIDERSDTYSVGLTFYELLTGKLPFAGESAGVVLFRQANETPWTPIDINPQLPQPLSDLIMKALEKDPAQRFQTAAEFGDTLGQVTGVAASEAVLIAGGFLEVMNPLSGATSIWVSPDQASHPENKRNKWVIAPALVTATVCAAFMAVGVSAYVGGGFTTKNSDRSTTESSQLPTDFTDEIKSDPEGHLTAASVAPTATTVQDSERAMASTPPEVKGIAKSSISPVLLQPPAARRTPDRAASKAAEEAARVDAGALETPTDEPKAKPVLSALSTSELQEVRRQKDALDARANAIRSQMTRLRNQKITDGYDVNQGLADAYVDMNLSLSAGSADLESGDVSAARTHVNKAIYEVSVLEKLFRENP